MVNKTQNGNLKPSDFNRVAPVAQLSLVNQLLSNEQEFTPGRPLSRYGFLVDQKIAEDLRPIIKIPTAFVFSAGVATYPADGLYIFNLGLSDNTIIKPVEWDEFQILSKSVIKPPIASAPMYYVLGNNIYIGPTSITNTLISYVRKPLTPVWNYSIINQIAVYNPVGSQDFEVGELLHFRIVQKILELSGVNLNLPQVTAFASALEAQGA